MGSGTSRLWTVVPAGRQAGGGWIDDVLRERAAEAGLSAKVPLAGHFPRQRVEVVNGDDAERRLNALYYARGWTDGLPVVAPTIDRVQSMVRFSRRGPDDALGEVDPLRGVATLEKLAANAVMAGCLPEYFPVVVAAVEAILDPAFNLRGVQTTDENVAPLLVVNGPIARALDLNASFGALGPGWRANATIGRALRLVMQNVGGGWPGAVSFAGIGQPGRYTLCLAENEAESPWAPLHTETGFSRDASAVTVMRAESIINVTGGLDELASVMGSAASAFSILWGGCSTVIVAPALAATLAKEGWTKHAVRERLFERGRWPTEAWRASWLHRTIGDAERWPEWARVAADRGALPAVRRPEDLVVVVAGGNTPIPQHAYCPSWGFPPARITRAVELPPDWDELLAQSAATEHERRDGA